MIKGRSVHHKQGENIDKSLRKLKKIIQNDKTLQNVKEREFYTKPTLARKAAKAAAVSRQRKANAKQQLKSRY
jgi:small subunit ribosomal protein S21